MFSTRAGSDIKSPVVARAGHTVTDWPTRGERLPRVRARISEREHFPIAPNDRNLSNTDPTDCQLPFAQCRSAHQFRKLGH
jgi:hypothetical protein